MTPLHRREFLKIAAATAAGLPLASCRPPSDGPGRGPARPNVLFVFSDQLRADACGVYGGLNVATPHIDRLARQGVTFTNAVSTCPLCSPYRGMLMTGRHPTHSGVVLNSVQVNPRQRCLAHVFRDAGYRTGYIGKWHLAAGCHRAGRATAPGPGSGDASLAGGRYGDDPYCGFVPPGPERLGFDHWEAYDFHMNFNDGWFYRDRPRRVMMSGYETDVEIDLAISFMQEGAAAQQPFFLAIAPHPPHPPHTPEQCPAGSLADIPQQLQWAPNVPDAQRRDRPLLAGRCYWAMAKNLDDNIGRLLAFLDASGLAADTIVVLTSDHGEMLGSHGRRGKCLPYAESVNLPLIVRWPRRLRSGRTVDGLFTPLDHLPTLCGLTGLQPPASIDGIDLSGAMLGTNTVRRDAVLLANYVSYFIRFESNTVFPEWRAVRTGRHTYVKWLRGGREELYDNAADPWQMDNLATGARSEALLRQMRVRMKDLLAEAHDDFLPGTAYAGWYDDRRNLIRTALGPVGKTD